MVDSARSSFSRNGDHAARAYPEPISNLDLLAPLDTFARRHIGPAEDDIQEMLATIGVDSLQTLMEQAIPQSIRLAQEPALPQAVGEQEALRQLRRLAGQNRLYRSFIGMGYYDTVTPGVILRNILENPGWYTQYTPYQAEIAQGRLEALLNFQTMVTDLTGLEIANASLLDEGTAAAEAMTMCKRAQSRNSTAQIFFVSQNCHPQTIDVVRTRAEPLGYQIVVGDPDGYEFGSETFGALIQYPDTEGTVEDLTSFVARAHAAGALVVVATDLLALTLLRPPGEFGADIAVGSSQRFGVPMGFGGPHAAFMATRDAHKRTMPGRLVGISVDSAGNPAYRLSLQTREQHIRRDKATSNICTAQVLLAIMASMYAVYHGPHGLRRIAQRVRLHALMVRAGLESMGYVTKPGAVFDTVKVTSGPLDQSQLLQRALARQVNLRAYDDGGVGISVDETTGSGEAALLFEIFGAGDAPDLSELARGVDLTYAAALARTAPFLTHPVFNSYHSETEMLRYITRLEQRDLSLAVSMIPLGSCTMKLNGTTEMVPVTWPEFASLHPFVPGEQAAGYHALFRDLEAWLAAATGFAAVSLQPNAGSQGEYAGLLVIRAYHLARGDRARRVCLIPSSAHGTNPASAIMAGMDVVVVRCDEDGNIDMVDLAQKLEAHGTELAAMMITYPSTHGVFEEDVVEACRLVHAHGGQVYIDGANMNAQVGLTHPAALGGDVCHLNLHKTFCIPHGGGGPGMGPICVAEHLAPFLPGHAVVTGVGGEQAIGAVSSAPWGSPNILPISYAYIAMMGAAGLTQATRVAILNANYMAARLEPHYPVLYKGAQGRVAHECILDTRSFHQFGIQAEDIAKRLMDYGFHAPTMSWPVANTLMIEPTESESKAELDRFCDAMIAIRAEVAAVERGEVSPERSVLRGAPHTARAIADPEWERDYSRQQAAFPAPWVVESKFWPAVGRIDNVYGDRNLVCTCLPIEAYA